MRCLLAAALAVSLSALPALAEAPRVVATTKPIYGLVAAVMGDVGKPALLVKGAASVHTYSLKPSDAAALEQADIVFWTGHGMELFLADSLGTLAPKAETVDLSQTPSLELLPTREGGAFEPHVHEGEDHDHDHADHDHDEDDHDHEHGEFDMHYWLDPANAVHMTDQIAKTLIAADPANADTYADNAAKATEALFALRTELQHKLDPVHDGRFVLFHDATQYFEHAFGLTAVGSLTVTPDTMPSARRIAELRAKLIETQARCVFAEPQFDSAIVTTLVEGTGAHAGSIDPEAATLIEGPDLYREMLQKLADDIASCLAS